MNDLLREIEDFEGQEGDEDAPTHVPQDEDTSTQRKRARSESTSRGTQVVEYEP